MMLMFSEQRRKRRDKWKRKQDSGGNVSPRSRAHTWHHLTNPWKKKRVARNNTDTVSFYWMEHMERARVVLGTTV